MSHGDKITDNSSTRPHQLLAILTVPPHPLASSSPRTKGFPRAGLDCPGCRSKAGKGLGRRPRSDHGGVLTRFGREANSGVKLGEGKLRRVYISMRRLVKTSLPSHFLSRFSHPSPLATCPSPPPPTPPTLLPLRENTSINGGIFTTRKPSTAFHQHPT